MQIMAAGAKGLYTKWAFLLKETPTILFNFVIIIILLFNFCLSQSR